MSSLRAAATRTRLVAIPTLVTQPRRTLTTGGNRPQSDRGKRPLPHGKSSLVDNAPGWNEELATASEAFVKADRETTSLDEMQQKTVEYVQSHHHDPELEQTHATYAREEIGGPLGNAGVGEFEGVVGDDDLGPDDPHIESNGRVVTRRVTPEKTTAHESKSGAGQGNA